LQRADGDAEVEVERLELTGWFAIGRRQDEVAEHA
jgi:hypothetical protein